MTPEEGAVLVGLLAFICVQLVVTNIHLGRIYTALKERQHGNDR